MKFRVLAFPLIIAVSIAGAPALTQAGKPDPTLSLSPWDCQQENCLEVTAGGSGNLLTWFGQTDFDVFGFDVHYASGTPTTANNNTRIETGAKDGQWLDNLDGWPDRCNASNYYIQAYNRGRKNYSEFIQGYSQDPDFNCDGNSGSDGLVVRPTGSVSDFIELDRTSSWRQPAVPDGWQMFAWEEFNGGSLQDLGEGGITFLTRQPWGPDMVTNGEWQYYLDELGGATAEDTDGQSWSPFQFVEKSTGDPATSNGYLVIQATKLVAPEPVTDTDWLSGVLSTHPGSTTGVGEFSPPFYFETRARMPRGKGLYPAIWFLDYHLTGGDEELDVIEYIGQSCTAVNADRTCKTWSTAEFGAGTWETQYHTYHDAQGNQYQSWTNSQQEEGISDDWNWWLEGDNNGVPDFSNEFHTYGIKYGLDEVVWYIDGIEVMKLLQGRGKPPRKDIFYPRKMPSSSMYLILNLAVNQGWFSQNPDESTEAHLNTGVTTDDPLGQNDVSMIIDYVRFYSP